MWKEVDTSGDRWKGEDNVLFSIFSCHYRQFSKQASTTNRPRLLAIVILSPSVALSVPYSLLF